MVRWIACLLVVGLAACGGSNDSGAGKSVDSGSAEGLAEDPVQEAGDAAGGLIEDAEQEAGEALDTADEAAAEAAGAAGEAGDK